MLRCVHGLTRTERKYSRCVHGTGVLPFHVLVSGLRGCVFLCFVLAGCVSLSFEVHVTGGYVVNVYVCIRVCVFLCESFVHNGSAPVVHT